MSNGTLLAYVALLVISGILLAVLAIGGFGQSTGARALDALFGVGFLAYAAYLLFFFEGDKVRILFYAFFVPIAAVATVVKSRKAKREEQSAAQSFSAPAPYQAGQPQQGQPQYGQPQQGQPQYGQPQQGAQYGPQQ